MVDDIKEEHVKKVITFDTSKNENGYLLELFKDKTGKKTEVYMSVTKPGCFKGYHLHKVRSARYICIKGKIKITLFLDGKFQEHILDSKENKRLFIPNNIPTGIENIGKEDAFLINYPDPSYDPDLKDEQIEYTREELEQGKLK